MMALQEKKSYQITTASKVRIGGRVSEFIQDRWVELQLTDQKDENLLFEYKLLDQTMEGTALIHQLTEDLEWLQTPLYFLTDLTGKFVGMQGLQQVKERWDNQFRDQLSKKYKQTPDFKQIISETDALLNDPKRLIQSFVGFNHFRALFQPFYKVHEPEAAFDLTIPRYFGEADLPLNIEQETTPYGERLLIKNVGGLDRKKFDSKVLVRMLKDLTNTYNLKVDLQVALEEEYVLFNGNLESAELFLEVSVPDFYQVTTAHQVQIIHAGSTDQETEKAIPGTLTLS